MRVRPRRGVLSRLTPPEQFGQTWQLQAEHYLSNRLGIGMRVYKRAPGHMALGYANPDDGSNSVDIAAPVYQGLYALRSGMHLPGMDNHYAKDAFALAHEIGHLRAPNHHSEAMANTYATRHYGSVLKQLGVGQAYRRRLIRLAQNQGLL